MNTNLAVDMMTGFVPVVLTHKEHEVLRWLAKGYTKAEVGKKLYVSRHTVDFHTRNILSKLGARNITAAVYYAMCLGLLQPE